MKSLRQIHLYLGCFFAPMLLFFALSGMWQMFGWDRNLYVLKILSTIHRGHGRKDLTQHFNSIAMEIFVTVMAVGLILSIITGIILAFKYGRGRWALASLLGGVFLPVLLVLLFGKLS